MRPEPALLLAGNIPPEGSADPVLRGKVSALNTRLRHHGAEDVLGVAVREIPDPALVSSFGADAVVLLHLAAMVTRDLPILFIDTELLFAETLVYQQEVAERLGLRNLHILRAQDIAARDPDTDLHRRDPDACCQLRKTAPLEAALAHHGGWITGRKRFQSRTRATLEHFEVDGARIKVNPLAHWSAGNISDYMDENRLPRHPLVAKGYPSIGCAPCTSPITAGEDPRAGRWRHQPKDECGIHFGQGRMIRTGEKT